MKTFISSQKLQSYLGQLIDLKNGFLEEIVIKPGENADELRKIVEVALRNELAREQMEAEHDLEELRAAEAETL